MVGCLVVFDIVLDLSAVGSAQADDPSGCTSIHEGHAIEDVEHILL
jgi:hypothetical protein